MTEKQYKIELTLDELMKLDGKVSEHAQKVIDRYSSTCPHFNSDKTSRMTDNFSFTLNPRAFEETIFIEKSVRDYNEGLGDKWGHIWNKKDTRRRTKIKVFKLRVRTYPSSFLIAVRKTTILTRKNASKDKKLHRLNTPLTINN